MKENYNLLGWLSYCFTLHGFGQVNPVSEEIINAEKKVCDNEFGG
jgi:hypothetical protein